MTEEPREPERRPRKRVRRALVRPAIELGAAGMLLVVVLVVLGVVIHAGRGESALPAGTLVVSQTSAPDTLDPALASALQTWEIEYATCAKLLDHPPRAGYAGTRLVPGVAALPRVSADRLTYSFTLSPGWRFSDGTKVTAAAFARAFQRARSAVMASPAEPYLREVASWTATGLHLTIRLKQVAPDFLQRLALPYFCAVPPSTPDFQVDKLPSAGPYEIAAYQPGDSLLLRRNPYYGGPRPGRFEEIRYRFGDYPSQIRLEIVRGQTDYAVLPTALFSDVAANLRGSARNLVVAQVPTVAYLALNTQRPLFRDNPQLRRAVNYAVDRPALARQFGYRGARPADQYLPPGFPGYEAGQLYPLAGPDLATARRLARGHLRGARLVFLSCGTVACKQRAEIVAADLGRIGLHVQIESTPGSGTQTLATVAGTKFDIADVITRPDYGDPYALVDKLLDGRTIRSVGNTNVSYFSDPRFDRQIDAAQKLTGVARDRAYGRLGVAIARTEAPLAAYAVLNARIFLSARVGCVRYQPVFGLDLAALCLRPQAVR